MLPSILFGIKEPLITKKELEKWLENLPVSGYQSLYFLYSEFLLRANRNPSYKQVLQAAKQTAIDGKGTLWAFLMARKEKIKIKNSLQFWLLFGRELLSNFFSGWQIIFLGRGFDRERLILGRQFLYTLLETAQKKNWQVAVLGGSKLVKENLSRIYPNLQVQFWFKSSQSDLMRDYSPLLEKLKQENQVQKTKQDSLILQHSFLNRENLLEAFPQLEEAKQFLAAKKPDLILVCLGGASGKQEFFIDHLVHSQLNYQTSFKPNSEADPETNFEQNSEPNFTLAVGLGAALDHLGAGRQQQEAPAVLQKIGLEWFYRFLFQPYRRRRIWDSIVTLWWLTSKERFLD